jgi:uncharacterized lipoprotein YehR (DUF1307 family)
MKILIKSILLLACMLSLIGLNGCEQAEEAKKAAGELITETVDKAQKVVGEVTGGEESEGQGEEEGAEPAEEKESE